MGDLVGSASGLSAAVEKGGVTFLLVLIAVVACAAVWHLRKELSKVYGQRDRALLGLMKLKTLCEAKGIAVDLSDVKDLLPNGEGGG